MLVLVLVLRLVLLNELRVITVRLKYWLVPYRYFRKR